MATKTKGRQGEVARLEEELRHLEEQRQRAADAILAAENELHEIKGRQDELAVAVIAEEEAAVSEMAELEETLLTATRRASVAKTAVGKLEEEISRAREDLEGERRRARREHADELGRERFALEEQLEERVAGLLEGLEALRDLDRRQRAALYEAGVADIFARHVLAYTLASWLSARLGGHNGYVPLAADDWHRDHALAELDGLARDPAERG